MRVRRTLVCGGLICGLMLAGCQKEQGEEGMELSEEIKNPEDGDHVTVQLTEDAVLDAEIEMPREGLDAAAIYHMEVDGFDGQEVLPKVLGKMPETGLMTQEIFFIDSGIAYSYKGVLGPEQGEASGMLAVNSLIMLRTEHWEKISPYLSIVSLGAEKLVNNADASEYQEEFDFAGREQAAEEMCQYVEKIGGYEEVRVVEEYAVSYLQLEKQQEYMNSLPEEEQILKPAEGQMEPWNEEDNCYWMSLEQIFHGLPVLNDGVTRQDDLNVPINTIEAACTRNGIEYVSMRAHYRELSSDEAELLPVEKIYEALQDKFELLISTPVTIDEMRLIYYPMPLATKENETMKCDMIPAWQFRVSQEDNKQYIYINAVDGIEITG